MNDKPQTETAGDWPYLLPTQRGKKGETLFHQFHGAVKTRIIERQKALWSRFIGVGFIAEDIKRVWPEDNLEFFGMRYSEHMQSFRLRDLNLRELEELDKWLTKHLPDFPSHEP